MVVTATGLEVGTVGGGKLEAHALRSAHTALGSTESLTCRLETVNLQTDLGMTCGGEVTLLYEVDTPSRWAIAVFGAGHVAQATVRVLLTLDAQVLVIDSRAEWLDRLPPAANLRVQLAVAPESVVASLAPGPAVAVMPQGHATDLPVLDSLLRWSQASYVGVLGSTVKAARLRRDLLALGHSASAVAAVRCPIGLAIGRSTPAEIAISVAAELIAVRDSVDPPFRLDSRGSGDRPG